VGRAVGSNTANNKVDTADDVAGGVYDHVGDGALRDIHHTGGHNVTNQGHSHNEPPFVKRLKRAKEQDNHLGCPFEATDKLKACPTL
jgi:hypothetical protein